MLKRLETARHVPASLVQEALAPSELVKRDEAGLVGVEEALRLTLQVRELLLDTSDIVHSLIGRPRGALVLQGGVRVQDQRRVLEVPPHLRPHEGVEFIGPEIPLRAWPGRGARPQDIVARAIVVVMKRAVAPPHPVTRHTQVADTAADQTAEQVVARLQMSGAEPAIVDVDRLRLVKRSASTMDGTASGIHSLVGRCRVRLFVRRRRAAVVGSPSTDSCRLKYIVPM